MHTTICMNPENIILRKVSQAEKIMQCMILFYKVQEEIKLIYGDRIQNSGCLGVVGMV